MPRFFVFVGLLVSVLGVSLLPLVSSHCGPDQASAATVLQADRPPAERGRKTPGAAAPIELSASDGTGLALVALEANAVLEPPLAFSELHLTFENPNERRIEGRFRISLPPGAALSRFAMKGDAGWQEGEVVERQRARQAYEDFLHRRQDPALLEQEAGNEFSARVFPIPPRGQKELIVSYSYPLPRAGQPFVIPLAGLPEIGRLDVRVLLGERPAAGSAASNLGGEVNERRVVELHKRAWTPDRDFEVGQEQISRRDGLRYANLAVARVAAPVAAARQEVGGLYVLIDSSASRALGYAEQVDKLAEVVSGLREAEGGGKRLGRLGIAAFDQEVVPVFDGAWDGFGPAELRRLHDRRPLGASDLGQALSWLASRLGRGGSGIERVLLVTDGVATAGPTETSELKAAVRALGAGGVRRLDVMAVGGLRDDGVLGELVTGNLAQDGARIDGSAPPGEILRRLTLACRSGIRVTVEGAAWVWPETLDGVQPGDEALVFADLAERKPFRLLLDGRQAPLAAGLAPAEKPLLERAWAQARIDRLVHLRAAAAGDDDLRRALELEIVDLSVRHRVVSPLTAMLVLETESDYARFGLDRRALADILTVGPGGLDVLARSGGSLPPAPAGEAKAERFGRLAELDAAAGRDGLRREKTTEPAEAPMGAAAGSFAASSEAVAPEQVAGGVEGGVAGGVAGGVMGGVPGGAIAAAQPTAAGGAPADASDASDRGRRSPARPVERPLPAPSAVPPPASPPRPVSQAGRGAVADQIQANAGEGQGQGDEKDSRETPYAGKFADVMADLAAGRVKRARDLAESWSAEAPGDVLALLALGECWEAAGEKRAAARAYGSLIDLFPSRADVRRLAGERLERLGSAGLDLAIDSYEKAVRQRPDHPTGHRLLAWALLRAGRFAAAFDALSEGMKRTYPSGRFPGLDRVLKEDLGMLAAAWLRTEPGRREEVLARLQAAGARLAVQPSLRFVLSWETDANDVDLHVFDHEGGHAFYQHRQLASGGELYADVTTGYGPECFAVTPPRSQAAAPYRLKVHYYSRGPMGYGMGVVQVVSHDGAGRIAIEPRPFVVMADNAMVDLGLVAPAGGGKPRPAPITGGGAAEN